MDDATIGFAGGSVCLVVLCLAACGVEQEEGTPPPAGATPEAFTLRDRTPELGPAFHHFNGRFGELVMTEIMGAGGALFDMDQDGDLDLYLRQGRPLWSPEDSRPASDQPPKGGLGDRIHRNDLQAGRASFVDVTSEYGLRVEDYGMGVVAGDFDGDSQIDLFLTNYGSDRMLYRGAAGEFVDVTEQAGVGDERWSTAASAFDYDRDGWLDLFVGGYIDLHAGNHRTCGDRDYCGPLTFPPQNDRLLRNRGDGSFEDVTGASGLLSTGRTLGSVVLDFDGDGWIDLYVANDASENLLWRNRGDGRFEEVALLTGTALNGEGSVEGSMGVDAADFDGDGDEDLFMGHIDSESNTLYVNQGGDYFLDRSIAAHLSTVSLPWTGFGLRFLDFDLDGWLDLVVANGAVRRREDQDRSGEELPLKEPDLVFHNSRDGTFRDLSSAFPAIRRWQVTRSVIAGDVDNDGDPDLVLTTNNGEARLLIDEPDGEPHWLGLRLRDPDDVRDMLGAEVWLHRGRDRPLHRRSRTDGGYLASHDPRVVFGLGDSADIERIVVRWPDGSREEWRDVRAGAYRTLIQGSGTKLE